MAIEGKKVKKVEGMPPKSKGPAMTEADRLIRQLFDHIGLFADVAINLDDLLRSEGFTDVWVEEKRMPVGRKFGESGEQGTRVLKPGYMKMASTMLDLKLIESIPEYLQMLDEMEAEWDEHGVEFPARLVTARKPKHVE